MAAIKVKLVSGLAGVPEKHRTIVQGLGLKKFNSEKVLPDSPSTMGMIDKVSYLITWEKTNAPAPQGRKARKGKKPAKKAAKQASA